MEALARSWKGHTGVRVPPLVGHPPTTSAETTRALIGSPCHRLPRPATAHSGLALPTTHPGATLARLATVNKSNK